MVGNGVKGDHSIPLIKIYVFESLNFALRLQTKVIKHIKFLRNFALLIGVISVLKKKMEITLLNY